MTIELKTNTATRIPVGPLVDPADGKTAELALDVTALSVQIYQTKNDGSAVVRVQFAPTASGGNNDMILVPSSTDGMYDLELTAANINFYGNARLSLYDVDGFLVWWVDIQVVSVNYFNNKYGTTIETVNTTQIEGSDATDTLGVAQTGDNYARIGALGVGLTEAGGDGDHLTAINLPNQTMDITGNLSGSVGSVTADVTTDTASRTASKADVSDIPNNAEFAARTLLSAAYTIVADLGVVQTADHTAGISAIFGEVSGLDGDVMRGTDSANTVEPDPAGTAPTLVEIWEYATRTLTAGTNLNDISVADIISGITDGSYDLQEMMRVIFGVLAGKSNGGGTTTLNLRDSGDTKNRVTATVDVNGNRTNVVLDGS